MSINRLIARMAVVSALNNNLKEPWPTYAGNMIFDSKIEPVEDIALDRAFPCIVVYTDYDKDPWTKGNAFTTDRMLTVTLELLVVQAAEVEGPEGTVWKIEAPVTDSEIEASLDILEMQAFRALTKGTPASDCFNYICETPTNVISRRGASIEGGQRLAARQITMEMKANRDLTNGTIPKEIEAFLVDLEANSADYKPMIDEIRRLMTVDANRPEGTMIAQTLGYSRQLEEILGKPVGPEVLLPSVDYNITRGAP